MVNFFSIPFRGALLGLVALILATIYPSQGHAGAPRFKKSTTVDFEGALVEGKSRKPYSTYLTQQRDSAFGALHTWQLDYDKKFLDALTAWEVQP